MEKNVIVRSNREYDYFGNVLEYEYDYFPSYSSTSTQKVLVLEYKYTSTITPSLMSIHLCVSATEVKVILDRDSSTVLLLRLSSHRQTMRVGSEFISKLYTI